MNFLGCNSALPLRILLIMKKNIKRIISIVLVFAVCLTLLLFLYACKEDNGTKINYEDFSISLRGDAYTIKEYTGSGGDITVPAKIGNTPVYEIAENAFRSTEVKKVTIQDGIRVIGSQAFSMSTLKEISIPASVTSIGANPFTTCLSLTAINVDEKNTKYKSENGDLYSKDGKTVVAYASNYSDKDFTVPEGIEEIASMCFYDVKFVERMHLPSTLKKIGDYAFFRCTLSDYVAAEGSAFMSEDGILYSDGGKTVFLVPYQKTGVFDSPSRVTAVAENAFAGSLFNEVNFNEGLLSIGKDAFRQSGLERIYLPSTLKNIGEYIFYECPFVEEITISASNPYFRMEDGIILSADKKEAYLYPTNTPKRELRLPDTVEIIKSGAFFKISNMDTLIFPPSVRRIETNGVWLYDSVALIFLGNVPAMLEKDALSVYNGAIYVPDAALDSYKDSASWEYYANKIKAVSELNN